MNRFANYFKERRLATGKSLRQFCLDNSFDAGNLSRMERGLTNPPAEEDLLKYAKALGINEGSDEWITLRDLAFIERNQIPPEILSNEQVISKLPIFFRSVRGEKVSEEQLRELVSLIKKS